MAQRKDQSDTLELPADLGKPLDLQASIDEAIAQAEREAREAGAPPVDDDTPIPDLTPPPPGGLPEAAAEPAGQAKIGPEAQDASHEAEPASDLVSASAEELEAMAEEDAEPAVIDEGAAPPVDEVEATLAAADDLGAQIDRLLDAGRRTAAGEAQTHAPEPTPATTPDPPDPAQLDQIDQLLAEQADVAIADELAESAPPTPPPVPVQAEAEKEVAPSEPDETVPVAAVTDPTEEQPPKTAPPRFRRPSLRELLSLQTAHKVCVILDKPIARASAQTRTLIGVIGLITLCNACALMMYAFLFV